MKVVVGLLFVWRTRFEVGEWLLLGCGDEGTLIARNVKAVVWKDAFVCGFLSE